MKQTNFLVIGSGIAGLIYALDVCRDGKVTILCKNNPAEGNTLYAQGGIASVTSELDSFDSHTRDTIEAGAGLSKYEVVRMVIEGGPGAIKRLAELGTRFDIEPDQPESIDIVGRESTESPVKSEEFFSLGLEGGHSERRILHFGDTTGAEIQRALLSKALSEENIEIIPNILALDLIRDTQKEPGPIIGCYGLDLVTNEVNTYSASVILLASGGLGKVYLYTSNPDVATGDGVAMAYRSGAQISNMEFIQFHPTCLYHPHAKNFLITEAMRGEGGRLITKNGRAFMSEYHTLGDLAPRDIVARAIDKELKASGDDCVYLDMRGLDAEYLKARFPSIHARLLTFNIDFTKDLIPVVPAAHYSCGGIRVNKDGETSIPGLFAAGEVSYTGLHGANRLASNSLLEAVVYGRRAAKKSIEISKLNSSNQKSTQIPTWDSLGTRNSSEKVLVTHAWDETRRIMWNLVGIVRSKKRLELARKRIKIIRDEIEGYYWKYQITGDLIELRNLLLVSSLIVKSALFREESRGLHHLEDFPAENPDLAGRDTCLIKGKDSYYDT